jgi:hypothetical protein
LGLGLKFYQKKSLWVCVSGFFGLENYVVENHVEFIFSIRRGLGFWGIWIYVEKQFEMTPESFFS